MPSKIEALADFLGVDVENIRPYLGDIFEVSELKNMAYLVLTDEEATVAAKKEIERDLLSFKAPLRELAIQIGPDYHWFRR